MSRSNARDKHAWQVRRWLRSFARSERWPADRMLDWQMGQVAALLKHAAGTSPYYQEALKGFALDAERALTPERIRDLPILTRGDIQEAGEHLNAVKMPKGHGWTGTVQSSGSTGQPVVVRTTQWIQTLWEAITLRDHLWQKRDLSLTNADIAYFPDSAKARTPEGDSAAGWAGVEPSGRYFYLDSIVPLDQQLDWLRRVDPGYLKVYPTNLAALADLSLERGVTLDSLVQVRTMGETLGPEQRAMARKAWGVGVSDVYSSQEVGYMALQAPDGEHYLVQSEAVYLEILDESGAPCAPGEIGRVVVTALHNFAAPLLRYEVGDFAEAGEGATCGRNLPVLSRILGRVRNMLTLPDGSRIWPMIGADTIADVAPVKQCQVIQKDLRRIEAKVVPRQALTAEQISAVGRHIVGRLGGDFEIEILCVDEIERGPTGKFEDFRSEVTASP